MSEHVPADPEVIETLEEALREARAGAPVVFSKGDSRGIRSVRMLYPIPVKQEQSGG